jgi:hypothetical protein
MEIQLLPGIIVACRYTDGRCNRKASTTEEKLPWGAPGVPFSFSY